MDTTNAASTPTHRVLQPFLLGGSGVGIGDFVDLSSLEAAEITRMTYLGWVHALEPADIAREQAYVAEVMAQTGEEFDEPEAVEPEAVVENPKPKRTRTPKAKPAVEETVEVAEPLTDNFAPLPDELG